MVAIIKIDEKELQALTDSGLEFQLMYRHEETDTVKQLENFNKMLAQFSKDVIKALNDIKYPKQNERNIQFKDDKRKG
jgi:hypothetical protein